MERVSQRIESISESATVAITARAKELRAAGKPVIGFAAGEPDFPTPDYIVEAARRAAGTTAMHKYTPAPGLPDLRAAVAAKTKRDSGIEVGADQVIITNGGKQAVYSTMQVLLDPGDEVLLPAPYWVSYPAAVGLAGGVTVEIPTDTESGFMVTVDQLEAARTDRTKLLIFVSPSNPTGAVYPAERMAEIGRWAAEHGVWVMTDEIYEHLIYGDAVFHSLPALVPELADRTVVVNGVAKTYAMTGWRVGWMVGPVDVIKGAAKLQSHMTSNVANVAQVAALEAVSGSLDAVHEMREAFDRRRRTMHRMLSEIDGVACLEPQGAFYAFPSFGPILERGVKGRPVTSSLELASIVLDEAEVAFVPGEAFGAPGYGRFSYALGDDDLVEGLGRVAELLGS
jgi:aspartate/methionine/tyrosine aminotransferase